jgi:hypothetical protein
MNYTNYKFKKALLLVFIILLRCNVFSQCSTLANGQVINGFVISKSSGIEELDKQVNEEYVKLCKFFTSSFSE